MSPVSDITQAFQEKRFDSKRIADDIIQDVFWHVPNLAALFQVTESPIDLEHETMNGPIKRGAFIAWSLAFSAALQSDASAQSSVSIYGVADAGLVYSSNQNGHSNTCMRSGNLAASKLGFKGTEDLGGGTQALFLLENGFEADTGATGLYQYRPQAQLLGRTRRCGHACFEHRSPESQLRPRV